MKAIVFFSVVCWKIVYRFEFLCVASVSSGRRKTRDRDAEVSGDDRAVDEARPRGSSAGKPQQRVARPTDDTRQGRRNTTA